MVVGSPILTSRFENVDAERRRLFIPDAKAGARHHPAARPADSAHSSDYAALRGLHQLANEQGIAVLVVHHTRKADADDRFDTVSGSTGLTGAADTTLILTRRESEGGTVLYGRGRDLEEFERGLEFDKDTCRWRDLGDPVEAFASDTRQAIFTAIRAGKHTPGGIAGAADITDENARQTLRRMVMAGDLTKEARGLYYLKSDPLTPCHNSHIVTNAEGESDKVTDVTGLEGGEL